MIVLYQSVTPSSVCSGVDLSRDKRPAARRRGGGHSSAGYIGHVAGCGGLPRGIEGRVREQVDRVRDVGRSAGRTADAASKRPVVSRSRAEASHLAARCPVTSDRARCGAHSANVRNAWAMFVVAPYT